MTREGTDFLIVTQYFPPETGAAQMRLSSVARALTATGHRVEVLTALPNYPLGRIFAGWSRRPVQRGVQDGIPTVRVWLWAAMGSGLGRLANYVSFGLMSIVGFAFTARPRCVVVEYPTLFGALPAVLLARARRVPVVIYVADLWVDLLTALGSLPAGVPNRVLLAVERWMLASADAVTIVSEGDRQVLVDKGVDPDRIAWLPNGADLDLFSPGAPDPADVAALGLAPGEHLLLYAGTHGYSHGLDVLLDAAERLEDDPVRFLLVGGGSERERLVAAAAERGLRNVTFWEPTTPAHIAALLRIATAGLACTRPGDQFRTVRLAKMLPVMASGTPLICSGDDEGARLVERERTGVRAPAGDVDALVAAVRTVVSDPGAAAAMGERGRSYVQRELSWDALVAGWLQEVEPVLARRDGPHGA